jgi:hypothetical protein
MGKFKDQDLNIKQIGESAKSYVDLKKKLSKNTSVIPTTKEKVLSIFPFVGSSITRKAKGGSVKKKKKFPDLSGDGKVTKKDILMAKGVIKKKKGKKKAKKRG